jgi:hypothetical protein
MATRQLQRPSHDPRELPVVHAFMANLARELNAAGEIVTDITERPGAYPPAPALVAVVPPPGPIYDIFVTLTRWEERETPRGLITIPHTESGLIAAFDPRNGKTFTPSEIGRLRAWGSGAVVSEGLGGIDYLLGGLGLAGLLRAAARPVLTRLAARAIQREASALERAIPGAVARTEEDFGRVITEWVPRNPATSKAIARRGVTTGTRGIEGRVMESRLAAEEVSRVIRTPEKGVPGYATGPGEVIGQVSKGRLPAAKYGTAKFGQGIEPDLVEIVHSRFPKTGFRFRTGRGQTGPDVEWISGEDPGFHIADFKPDTRSGYAKFVSQVRRLWTGGKMAPETGPFKAAAILYQTDGTVFIGDIATAAGF